MVAIRIKDAFIEYSGGTVAVNHVSYEFEYGKMYGIMGESGAGKSSLIHALATLLPLSSGEIFIANSSISLLNERQIAQLRRDVVGLVLQSNYLSPKLTAVENVMLPMMAGGQRKKNQIDKIRQLLDILGLSERMEAFPDEMSGGEQQRACIARALVNDPSIIMADEPTGNLDNENQQKVFTILKRNAQNGKCVIIISHAKEIADYADVMLTMRRGQLIQSGG